jgi:hypothetical protein
LPSPACFHPFERTLDEVERIVVKKAISLPGKLLYGCVGLAYSPPSSAKALMRGCSAEFPRSALLFSNVCANIASDNTPYYTKGEVVVSGRKLYMVVMTVSVKNYNDANYNTFINAFQII